MIQFSELETRLFGLRMGRIDAFEIEPASLERELLEGNYDVVRMKLSTKNQHTELGLRKLGIPFSLSGIIERFWISKDDFDIKPQLKTGLVFEEYSAKWRKEFQSGLEACFSDQSYGFFESPYFQLFVSQNLQIKAFTTYHLEQLEHNPSQFRGWAVLNNGEFAGFLINTIQEQTTETILAGVVPRFRTQQIYRDIVRYSQNFGKISGKKGGSCGARIQNELSKSLFINEGMKTEESFLVYYICPFFGLQTTTPLKYEYKTEQNPLAVIDRLLETKLNPWTLTSLQLKYFKSWKKSQVSCQIIQNESSHSALALVGFLDSNNSLCSSAWLDLRTK